MTSPEAHMHAWKERLAALARHPLALPTLFVVALVEASLIPIPPDMLLIPLTLARPRRTFLIATVCIAGSVTGAMIGYAIGATLFDSVGEKFVAALGVAVVLATTLSLIAWSEYSALESRLRGLSENELGSLDALWGGGCAVDSGPNGKARLGYALLLDTLDAPGADGAPRLAEVFAKAHAAGLST